MLFYKKQNKTKQNKKQNKTKKKKKKLLQCSNKYSNN